VGGSPSQAPWASCGAYLVRWLACGGIPRQKAGLRGHVLCVSQQQTGLRGHVQAFRRRKHQEQQEKEMQLQEQRSQVGSGQCMGGQPCPTPLFDPAPAAWCPGACLR
jgi:hypothetical protein